MRESCRVCHISHLAYRAFPERAMEVDRYSAHAPTSLTPKALALGCPPYACSYPPLANRGLA